MTLSCPCCSKKKYNDCCGILHQGKAAENALQLMRSRYSAYALHLPDYIIHTTHPNNPLYRQDITQWRKEILHFCENTHFDKLEIIEFTDNTEESYVHFIAYLSQNNKEFKLEERSQFKKLNGRWLYYNADIKKQ
jgi:SEC-C motif domain protein